jgi:hypothetical protein
MIGRGVREITEAGMVVRIGVMLGIGSMVEVIGIDAILEIGKEITDLDLHPQLDLLLQHHDLHHPSPSPRPLHPPSPRLKLPPHRQPRI